SWHHLPCFAAVPTAIESTIVRIRCLDHRNGLLWVLAKKINADPAYLSRWQSFCCSVPMLAAISADIDAAARTSEIPTIGVMNMIVQRGEHMFRIFGVDSNVITGAFLICIENLSPDFAAVCCFIDATIRTIAPGASKNGNHHNIVVLGINGD